MSKLACQNHDYQTQILPQYMAKFIRVRFILLACLLGMTPLISSADISITIAPPPLPVYDQPECPGDGYLWIPGYWAYGDDDYYWVPGTWILAPQPGFLWTPGYWGFEGGNYGWHRGYWGPHIGFYGGVNYGFGYFGSGFGGGRWEGGRFLCNTAVWRVNNTVVHNTYIDRTVIRNVSVNRVSFNGQGGIDARATAEEEAATREQHLEATQEQRTHEQTFIRDNNQRFSVNKGNPTRTVVTRGGAREEVNRPAATPGEHREANQEQRLREQGAKEKQQVNGGEEQGTKVREQGNREQGNREQGPKQREQVTKGQEQGNREEAKPKEPINRERPQERVKPETQNQEHREPNNKPAEEKAKGENKGEKGKQEKGKDNQQ